MNENIWKEKWSKSQIKAMLLEEEQAFWQRDTGIERAQLAAKKTYCIDTGLANAIGFTFSANTGRLVENLVFLALRRKVSEIYYYTTPAGFEVDFYLPEQRLLIQVAQNMNPYTIYQPTSFPLPP